MPGGEVDKTQLPEALKFIAAVQSLIDNAPPEILAERMDEMAELSRQRDVVSLAVAKALLSGELTEEP